MELVVGPASPALRWRCVQDDGPPEFTEDQLAAAFSAKTGRAGLGDKAAERLVDPLTPEVRCSVHPAAHPGQGEPDAKKKPTRTVKRRTPDVTPMLLTSDSGLSELLREMTAIAPRLTGKRGNEVRGCGWSAGDREAAPRA